MSFGTPKLTFMVGGSEIPIAEVFEIQIEKDHYQPDLCSVTVSNVRASRSASLTQGAPVVVSSDSGPIFQGELLGLEPLYDYGLPSRCTIRALNKMHKLTHGKKSRTFEKMTDQQIVQKICQEVVFRPSARTTSPSSTTTSTSTTRRTSSSSGSVPPASTTTSSSRTTSSTSSRARPTRRR